MEDLLEQIDGKEISLNTGSKVLDTKNAEIIHIEMDFKQKILGLLSDPNIALY
jgi:membrane-bound serine protease (ClpP class)